MTFFLYFVFAVLIAILVKFSRLFLFTQHGKSPLHMAAENNREEIAKLLLAAGANIDLQDKVTVFFVQLIHLTVL